MNVLDKLFKNEITNTIRHRMKKIVSYMSALKFHETFLRFAILKAYFD